MNNARLAMESILEEETVDLSWFREREVKLIKTIEALQVITKSQEWSSLKTLEFDSLKQGLERQILVEAKLPNPDTNKLSRLAGELKWAERYVDVDKWIRDLRSELQNIKLKLHGSS